MSSHHQFCAEASKKWTRMSTTCSVVMELEGASRWSSLICRDAWRWRNRILWHTNERQRELQSSDFASRHTLIQLSKPEFIYSNCRIILATMHTLLSDLPWCFYTWEHCSFPAFAPASQRSRIRRWQRASSCRAWCGVSSFFFAPRSFMLTWKVLRLKI